MRERPILFNGAMVRAILDGRKTQTRRAVKLPWAPASLGEWEAGTISADPAANSTGLPIPLQGCIWHTRTGKSLMCPHGQSGDRLWVRETWGYRGSCWSTESPDEKAVDIHYQADDGRASYNRAVDDHSGLPKQRAPRPDEDYIEDYYNGYLDRYWKQWRPSIHMPRWACRLVLEITDVRVERLQAISEADAVAEGVSTPGPFAAHHFMDVWKATGGDWAGNPWVWVIGFQPVEA